MHSDLHIWTGSLHYPITREATDGPLAFIRISTASSGGMKCHQQLDNLCRCMLSSITFPSLWTSLSWNNTDKKSLSKTMTPNLVSRGYDWLKVHRTSLLPLPHSPDSYSVCLPSLKRNSSSFSSYFVAVIPISGRPCIVSSHSCRGLTELTIPEWGRHVEVCAVASLFTSCSVS